MTTTDTTPAATVREVAEYLRVSEQTVRTHADSIGSFRVGRLIRFEWADVERYKNRHRSRDPLAYTELSAKRQAAKHRRAS